jgi:hypothetical protein
MNTPDPFYEPDDNEALIVIGVVLLAIYILAHSIH